MVDEAKKATREPSKRQSTKKGARKKSGAAAKAVKAASPSKKRATPKKPAAPKKAAAPKKGSTRKRSSSPRKATVKSAEPAQQPRPTPRQAPPQPGAQARADGPVHGSARSERTSRGREGRWGVSDVLKKALSSGYRAVSEEGLKGAIADAVPKELVMYMMRQTDAAKDEVVRVIGQQIKRFLENLDLAGEIQKILTAVSFEVRTEIRFIPNEDGSRPKARVKVTAKPSVEGDGTSSAQRTAVMQTARDVLSTALSRFSSDLMQVEVEADDEVEGPRTD